MSLTWYWHTVMRLLVCPVFHMTTHLELLMVMHEVYPDVTCTCVETLAIRPCDYCQYCAVQSCYVLQWQLFFSLEAKEIVTKQLHYNYMEQSLC